MSTINSTDTNAYRTDTNNWVNLLQSSITNLSNIASSNNIVKYENNSGLVDNSKLLNVDPDKKSFKDILGGVTSGTLNTLGNQYVGAASSMINGLMHSNSKYADDPTANLQSSVRTGITDMVMKSNNPYLMAIGAAANIADGIMDATGARASNITKDQQQAVGLSGFDRFLNNSMNFLPGNPLSMGGKSVSDANISMEAEKLRGAYSDALSDMDTAVEMSGKKYNFMLGGNKRNKIESFIKEQNKRNELLIDLSKTNTLRKQSDYAQELNKQNSNKYSGYTYQNMAVGKEGMKIPSFKDGGIVGIDSSVLPEGALHKELNHMEDQNKELDKVITDKGIAVITTDNDGKIEQVAEIEREELILRKDITDQIETLWKDGSEEAMLKAGKIITKELIKNTDDNTEEMLNGND